MFGSTIAFHLAELGKEVTVFEQNFQLLDGSTPRSVLRLHLGLHYPRDVLTAKQSIEGFRHFVSEYAEAVDFDFDNFYGISAVGSKVDSNQFRTFLREVRAPFSERDVGELDKYGFEASRLESLFSSPEGVVEPSRLRKLLESRLQEADVDVRLSKKVSRLIHSGFGWLILDSEGQEMGYFDLVVLATYGLDEIVIQSEVATRQLLFEFQNTLVLRASLPRLRGLGITVIDGDFLTLLPEAFGEHHLVYAPNPSVISREESHQATATTHGTYSEGDWAIASNQILDRLKHFFPHQEEDIVFEELRGKRAVEAQVRQTDRRQTNLLELGPGLVSIMSGKIDHCFLGAKKIEHWILDSEGAI